MTPEAALAKLHYLLSKKLSYQEVKEQMQQIIKRRNVALAKNNVPCLTSSYVGHIYQYSLSTLLIA